MDVVQIAETIQTLYEIGFHVRVVISDNHSSNVTAFNNLYSKYGYASHENLITHCCTSDVVVTRPLQRDGGMAEHHGASEAGQLPRA